MEAHEIVTVVVLIAILVVVLVLAFNPMGCCGASPACARDLQPSCASGIDYAQSTSMPFSQMQYPPWTTVYNADTAMAQDQAMTQNGIADRLGAFSLTGDNGEQVIPAGSHTSTTAPAGTGFTQFAQAPAGMNPSEWDGGAAAATGVASAYMGDAGAVKANYQNAVNEMGRIHFRGSKNSTRTIARAIGSTTGTYSLQPSPRPPIMPPCMPMLGVPDFHPAFAMQQEAIDLEDMQRLTARGQAASSPLIKTL